MGVGGRPVGAVGVHVAEDVVDVGEVVVVGEEVIGVRVDKEVSSRTAALPQKPYRSSPVQDHERRGSRGLLSRPTVNAATQDGEDLIGGVMLEN